MRSIEDMNRDAVPLAPFIYKIGTGCPGEIMNLFGMEFNGSFFIFFPEFFNLFELFFMTIFPEGVILGLEQRPQLMHPTEQTSLTALPEF